MLKIWGRNTSSNVQKVIWALAEMNIPFERIDVGGAFGKTKDAFYLAMNPNSLVPTLEEEDGFTLWESNSITRYLAGKHAARVLEPADLKVRAEGWASHLRANGLAVEVVRDQGFSGGVRIRPQNTGVIAGAITDSCQSIHIWARARTFRSAGSSTRAECFPAR